MSTCPFCQASLSDAQVQSGKCPACGHPLWAEKDADQQVPAGQSPEETGKTVPADASEAGELGEAKDPRLAETVSMPGKPASGPPKEDSDEAEDPRLAETISMPVEPGSGPPKEDSDEAKDPRLAETVDLDGTPVFDPSQKDPGKAKDPRLAETTLMKSTPTPPPPEEEPAKDDRRGAETIHTDSAPVPPPAEADSGKAEEPRVAETIRTVTESVPPPDEGARDTADQERVAETIRTGVGPVPPPEEGARDTADQERVAETIRTGVGPVPPPEEGAGDAADQERVAESIRTGVGPVPPPEEGAGDAADQERVAESIRTGIGPVPPPEEGAGDAADPERVAEIIQTGVEPVPPLQEEARDTADEERLAETIESGRARLDSGAGDSDMSSRLAQTRESDELAPEDLERISRVWSDTIQPDTSPTTSLKAESKSIEAESNLVIQTRIMREMTDKDAVGADYELESQLGEGGMGIVFAARQASIDRTVAVKMLKPAGAADEEERGKFLAEAVVTGDLEHPNIVPVYDVGKSEEAALFYSMKRVRGTPWDREISEKPFQENVEILMKISDAVALAHSRGVVHRDLKPENVMLGDFGEVLLMDWGLAVSPSNTRGTGMGGTPAYMAPEMASGPIEQIGPYSDIYLLGAILYEIITGKAPHTGKTVMECLFAAAKNEIQPTEHSGELMDIAMKAMAMAPEKRYASVGDLQDAIRGYQSHSESISLSTRAAEDLAEAEQEENYETFARSRFGFQEAFDLWDGNTRAKEGVSEASLAYARCALKKGDFDLGASLLDADNPQHVDVIQEIKAAQQERDARQQRLKTFKRIGAGLVATVVIVITAAFFLVQAEKTRAVAAEGRAVAGEKRAKKAEVRAKKGERKAKEAKARAKEDERKAKEAEGIAKQEAERARLAEQLAETRRQKEEYRAYIAGIGLAAAKIEENAFDVAKDVLNQCPSHLRDWEWGRLMHLCSLDFHTFPEKAPLDCVALSPDGKRFVTGGWGGMACIWDRESGEQVRNITVGGEYVFAVAFSPDGKLVATGGNDMPDYVKIRDAETGKLIQTLKGHKDAVLSVMYSSDGKKLLTSSYDRTVRLWELEEDKESPEFVESRKFVGHDWWVWSVAFSPDEKRIVTAGQDGSVMVWSVETGKPEATFTGHRAPVYAAQFSPDGKYVVSGGNDKRVLLWEPKEINPFDYDTLHIKDKKSPPPKFEIVGAHEGGVRSVQFSSDGKRLVSGGNDNTVKVWDIESRTLLKTIRGHGGRVRSCQFYPASSDFPDPPGNWVLSVSRDGQAKLWNIEGYQEMRVLRGRVLRGHADAVLDASFSPSPKDQMIVTASRDRTAKTWDFASGKELHEFKEGHDFLVSTAVFCPGGKKLLTAAFDNTTRFWDVKTGTQLGDAFEGTGPSGVVALSHDATRILTGSDDTTAKLWDAKTGKRLRLLECKASEVTAVAFSPDDKLLFAGDAKGRCFLWDAETGEKQWEVRNHSGAVTAASFLPSGERILTASVDKTVGQCDTKTGTEQPSLGLEHPGAVMSMALSPDGRHALTVCVDETARTRTTDQEDERGKNDAMNRAVRLWDIETGKMVDQLVSSEVAINSVAFSPDGRRAVTVSAEKEDDNKKDDNTIRFWNLDTRKEIMPVENVRQMFRSFRAGGGKIWSAIFSPEGKLLTVGGNEACLWDLKKGLMSVRFSPHDSVATANFSPDGKHIVTGSLDNTARIWDVETGLAKLRLDGGHTRLVNSAVFSPDGNKVLTASDDHTVKLWNAGTGKIIRTFEGHDERVRSAVFSPDGKHVLTASNDKTARIWDAETGDELLKLAGHEEAVLCAAFDTAGNRVITGSEDTRAKVWDAKSGKELLTLSGHTAGVTSVAFSPKQKQGAERAITGSQDNTVKVWEMKQAKAKDKEGAKEEAEEEGKKKHGQELLTLKGHSQEVTSVAFSPDGRSVLSGSRDGTCIVWLTMDWWGMDPGDDVAGQESRQAALAP